MNASVVHPLRRLRNRLIAWYALTFCVILTLLGGGLYLTVRRQLTQQLDESLRNATAALERAARIREMESGARGRVVDAVDELHIPERTLFLLDTTGTVEHPDSAPVWVRAAARTATTSGSLASVSDASADRQLRLRAERFLLESGRPLVAIAVADQVELEDQYASLIAAFGVAAMVAVLLVAGAGSLLVRTSLAPVEALIAHMRRFMADAAHEMRTPLTVIRSRADVTLQQPRSAPEYVAALSGVGDEARRLGHIVEGLLTLARAEAGERPPQRQRVFLDDIVSDAVAAATALATARSVELTLTEFEEAPVDGDSALLHQLSMILLDNAIKFTPAGGRVTVRIGRQHGRIALMVEDTGGGIAADHLPHVFERFYRGDRSRTRGETRGPGDGAGLGLSIAQWIAQMHEATIDLRSQLGEGTQVKVVFPPAEGASLSSS